jgi:hypothetical protein
MIKLNQAISDLELSRYGVTEITGLPEILPIVNECIELDGKRYQMRLECLEKLGRIIKWPVPFLLTLKNHKLGWKVLEELPLDKIRAFYEKDDVLIDVDEFLSINTDDILRILKETRPDSVDLISYEDGKITLSLYNQSSSSFFTHEGVQFEFGKTIINPKAYYTYVSGNSEVQIPMTLQSGLKEKEQNIGQIIESFSYTKGSSSRFDKIKDTAIPRETYISLVSLLCKTHRLTKQKGVFLQIIENLSSITWDQAYSVIIEDIQADIKLGSKLRTQVARLFGELSERWDPSFSCNYCNQTSYIETKAVIQENGVTLQGLF